MKMRWNQLWIGLMLSTGAAMAQTNTFPSTGNVGIGTTGPLANLDVRNSTGYHFMIPNGSSWGFSGTALGSLNDGATSFQPLGIWGSSISLLGGNVGIGTTSPAYPLDVQGTVRATQLNLGTNSANYVGSDNFSTYISAVGDTYFQNGSIYPMVIQNSGNVGIGTTSPVESTEFAPTKGNQNNA